jgi:hypothetical protein
MPITVLSKHDQHEVYIQLEYFTAINHYASLRCKDCNKHIQWLNKWDVNEIKELGVKISPHRSASPNTPKEFKHSTVKRGGWL